MTVIVFFIGLACLFFWMKAFSKYQHVKGGLKIWSLNLLICGMVCYYLISANKSSSNGYDGWGNGITYIFTLGLVMVILLVWGIVINFMASKKVATTSSLPNPNDDILDDVENL